jgi:hypothetical protein
MIRVGVRKAKDVRLVKPRSERPMAKDRRQLVFSQARKQNKRFVKAALNPAPFGEPPAEKNEPSVFERTEVSQHAPCQGTSRKREKARHLH